MAQGKTIKSFDPKALVDGLLDQIIDAAQIEGRAVVSEFEARGYRTADGGRPEVVEDLREAPRHLSRKVSQRYVKLSAAYAGGQGFVTGLGGLITLPATVPADAAGYVYWLARSGSAIQQAHGFETHTPTGDALLKLAMLAGAGVSQVTVNGVHVLVANLSKRVLTTPYAKAPVQAAVKALAAKLGVQLTHKSFSKAVPVLGGVINGSVHGTMVRAGGLRMLAHYQELAKDAGDLAEHSASEGG